MGQVPAFNVHVYCGGEKSLGRKTAAAKAAMIRARTNPGAWRRPPKIAKTSPSVNERPGRVEMRPGNGRQRGDEGEKRASRGDRICRKRQARVPGRQAFGHDAGTHGGGQEERRPGASAHSIRAIQPSPMRLSAAPNSAGVSVASGKARRAAARASSAA